MTCSTVRVRCNAGDDETIRCCVHGSRRRNLASDWLKAIMHGNCMFWLYKREGG